MDEWAAFGAPALWFLLGFVWFAPFLQSFLAQSFFLFRPPVLAELRHIEYSWHEVLRRAGIGDRAKFRLWIQDTDDLNASAAGGSIVSVTRGALRYSDHLGAVLAHELGHHLNGHTYPGLLAWWFSRPLYWIRRLARLGLRIALAILQFISYLNALVALVGYLFIGSVYLFVLISIGRGIFWVWETSWAAILVLALALDSGPGDEPSGRVPGRPDRCPAGLWSRVGRRLPGLAVPRRLRRPPPPRPACPVPGLAPSTACPGAIEEYAELSDYWAEGKRKDVVEAWKQDGTWLVPPLLISLDLLEPKTEGWQLIEGRTRVGVLRGRVAQGLYVATHHDIWAGRP